MEMRNDTPFAARILAGSDPEGADSVVLIAKATFSVLPGSEPELATEQAEVEVADVYVDEPGRSSIATASDLCIAKPGTDLVLTGSARPPVDQREWDVLFQVGGHARALHLSGPRYWDQVLGVARITKPEPVASVPLLWELAFGGSDDTPSKDKHHGFEASNPIGRGFRAKRSKKAIEGEPLPCIEDPAQLIRKPKDRPAPAGTGYVLPGWDPRARFAGTYDEAWQRNRSPLLPRDFDPRFYDRAPAGLVAAEAPKAGEWVSVRGCDPDGDYRFQLPELALESQLVLADGLEPIELHCDTVLVDLDQRALHLTWSGHRRVQGRIRSVVGGMLSSPAWRATA